MSSSQLVLIEIVLIGTFPFCSVAGKPAACSLPRPYEPRREGRQTTLSSEGRSGLGRSRVRPRVSRQRGSTTRFACRAELASRLSGFPPDGLLSLHGREQINIHRSRSYLRLVGPVPARDRSASASHARRGSRPGKESPGR